MSWPKDIASSMPGTELMISESRLRVPSSSPNNPPSTDCTLTLGSISWINLRIPLRTSYQCLWWGLVPWWPSGRNNRWGCAQDQWRWWESFCSAARWEWPNCCWWWSCRPRPYRPRRSSEGFSGRRCFEGFLRISSASRIMLSVIISEIQFGFNFKRIWKEKKREWVDGDEEVRE